MPSDAGFLDARTDLLDGPLHIAIYENQLEAWVHDPDHDFPYLVGFCFVDEEEELPEKILMNMRVLHKFGRKELVK